MLKTWNKTIEATSFKSIPPQPYNKLETFFSSHAQLFNQSEDCLYLNIWCQIINIKISLSLSILWWWLCERTWFSGTLYT